MSALDDVFETWVLSCNSRVLSLARFENGKFVKVREHTLSEAIDPIIHRSSEYDAVVKDWLQLVDADVVHIRHLIWHSLSLPRLAKRSGARVFYSLHDFYTLCPSLKLLDENNIFCDGLCTATNGTCEVNLWKTDAFPYLKNGWVNQWRSLMANAIEPCDGFITTSSSAGERILRHMPSIPKKRFHVIPHGRDFSGFEKLCETPKFQERIRILIPGNIDDAKGLKIITDVLLLDVQERFEFHILGNINERKIKGHVPRLIRHGSYEREDFARKVREIMPHFGAVFSIWDETFCHTLTEMWSVGLPVAVLDFPTLRARVENNGGGWVIENISPEGVYEVLSELANTPSEVENKANAVVTWQSLGGAGNSCRQMAIRYLDVYRTPEKTKPTPSIAVLVSSQSSKNVPDASSEIRVLERTRNGIGRPINYIRMDINGLLSNMKMGDINGAIIQRTAIPAELIHEFVEISKTKNFPYIYEIDDNLLEVPAEKDTDGFYASNRPFMVELIRNAAALIVSTDPLAEKLRLYNDRVEIVPNKVSSRLWGGSLPDYIDHPPRLLYMGTPTHDEDLAFVLPAIELVRKIHPTLRLSLIGVTARGDLPNWVDVIPLDNSNKSYPHFVPWIKTKVQDIDLAIAPMAQREFNIFKSGIKVLDYAALGLPVIASKVPSYQDFLGSHPPEGVSLIQNSVETWAKVIQMKLNHRLGLRDQGQSLRKWAFENHALEPTLKAYDKLILSAVGDRK